MSCSSQGRVVDRRGVRHLAFRAECGLGASRTTGLKLVRSCLNKDAAGRPSARDVLGELVAAGARLVGPMPPAASAPPEPRSASGDGLIAAGPGSRHRSGRRRSGRARRRRQAAAIAVASGPGQLSSRRARPQPSPARRVSRPARGPQCSDRPGPRRARRSLTGEELWSDRKPSNFWIVQQVSRAEIVACDPQVCTGLVAKGIPLADLDTIGNTSTDPLGSNSGGRHRRHPSPVRRSASRRLRPSHHRELRLRERQDRDPVDPSCGHQGAHRAALAERT